MRIRRAIATISVLLIVAIGLTGDARIVHTPIGSDCRGITSGGQLDTMRPSPLDLSRPPMGYNPYNHAGLRADQADILSAAHAIGRRGLRQAGYRFVNLDDGWQASQRDAAGDLEADAAKFPCGIAALAAAVHHEGLWMGIYTAASDRACGGGPGSQGMVSRDVRRFAAWGIDLIKLDWCGASYDANDARAVVEKWQVAIKTVGRPMYLMVNAGGAPVVLKAIAGAANSFRVGGDICATWSVPQNSSRCLDQHYNLGLLEYLMLDWNQLTALVPPGHAPDPDMLEIGNGLSVDESQTQFTLWSLWSAPLIMGNDIAAMEPTDAAYQTLLNRRLIGIDQDPSRGARLERTIDGVQYWRRTLADGTTVLAAVNLTESPTNVRLALPTGLNAVCDVVDYWTGDRFPPTAYYESVLRPHAVRVLAFESGAACHNNGN